VSAAATRCAKPPTMNGILAKIYFKIAERKCSEISIS
jgi:hypothetical protein